jgi:hypothetical protein
MRCVFGSHDASHNYSFLWMIRSKSRRFSLDALLFRSAICQSYECYKTVSYPRILSWFSVSTVWSSVLYRFPQRFSSPLTISCIMKRFPELLRLFDDCEWHFISPPCRATVLVCVERFSIRFPCFAWSFPLSVVLCIVLQSSLDLVENVRSREFHFIPGLPDYTLQLDISICSRTI